MKTCGFALWMLLLLQMRTFGFFSVFFKSRSDLGARSVSCLYVDGMNVFAEMKPILAKCVFGLESVICIYDT